MPLSTNGPSKYFKTKLGNVVGFISPLTDNFCSSCNRIRVTSNGMLYPCLGDNGSVNLKKALQQDYLYDSTELKFMKEQLSILEKEIEKNREKKSKGFGK